MNNGNLYKPILTRSRKKQRYSNATYGMMRRSSFHINRRSSFSEGGWCSSKADIATWSLCIILSSVHPLDLNVASIFSYWLVGTVARPSFNAVDLRFFLRHSIKNRMGRELVATTLSIYLVSVVRFMVCKDKAVFDRFSHTGVDSGIFDP